MEIAQRLGEMDFRLYGREGFALVDEVAQFNCMGCTLYKIYINFLEILHNIKRAHKF